MTASSTRRSRSESSGNAIRLSIVTTSDHRQRCGQRVEPQPAGWAEPEPILFDPSPAGIDPCRCGVQLMSVEQQAVCCSQPKVHLLRDAVLARQDFRSCDRIGSFTQTSSPGGILSLVPSADVSIVAVCRGTETDV